MRKVSGLVALVLFISVCAVAQAGQQAATATDVYHVHFTKAALGQAAALGESLATPDSKAPMPGHFILLRHLEGDDWDYVVIEHLGSKATVDASPSPIPAAVRDMSAWHGDTFVSGPSWAEFSKEMGLDQSGKQGNPVYIVSTYRAAPGHRDQMQKMLSAPSSNPKIGAVLLQHLEGGPWNFLSVTRYNSWQDLAADRATPANADGWNETRMHTASHHDTIADRVTPKK